MRPNKDLFKIAMNQCKGNVDLAKERIQRVLGLVKKHEPYIAGLNEREKSAAANQTNTRRYGNEQQH